MRELFHKDFGNIHLFEEVIENPNGKSKAVVVLDFVAIQKPHNVVHLYFRDRNQVNDYIKEIKKAEEDLISKKPLEVSKTSHVEPDRLMGNLILWDDKHENYNYLNKEDASGLIDALNNIIF